MTVPKGYCRAEVVRRVDTAPDLAVFWLRCPEPLDYQPGQYATIAIDDHGYTVKRPYSVCSAPHEESLELFVELVGQGALTPKLFCLEAGDSMLVREHLAGHFLRDTEQTCHAFAATVTGVAPFVSMVRAHAHALEQGAPNDQRFLIVHGASRPDEIAFYHAELSALADEADWFTYVPTISRPWTAPDWEGETGRVEDVLRKHLDAAGFAAEDTAAYACGNPQMVQNAKGVFARARIASDRIYEEQYYTPKGAEAAPPPATTPHVERPRPRTGRLPGVKKA